MRQSDQHVVAVVAAGFAMLAAVAGAAVPAWARPPQRIVSLNVCVDQILVDLVPRERIAAVTHLATDLLSAAYPKRARGLPSTRGAAEEVLARDPDLIIAGAYTTSATVSLLRRVGRRVAVVAQPSTIAGVQDLIRDMAAIVEAPEAGAAMIAALTARIDAVRARAETMPRPAPTAIVYQVNNYVSASGSLIDEALQVAGFQNGGGRYARARSGQVSLEALLGAPPEVLILATGPTTYRTAVADNLRHPALQRMAAKVPTHVVPWPLWLCGTQHIADAIEQMHALRK